MSDETPSSELYPTLAVSMMSPLNFGTVLDAVAALDGFEGRGKSSG
jgi:hypothetical protein